MLTYYEIFHIKFGHDKYGYYEWADVGSDELISIDSKNMRSKTELYVPKQSRLSLSIGRAMTSIVLVLEQIF